MKATIKTRTKTHGKFEENSEISQKLKGVFKQTKNWKRLPSLQKEALEMIAHKISRALAGDPNFKDHWHDIAGYATLIERNLNE